MLGTRSRTPSGVKSLDRLDAFGRKSQVPKRLRRTNVEMREVDQNPVHNYNGTPLMDTILLEIRTHVDEAKEEITILQH